MKERKFVVDSVKKLLVSEYIRKETENAGFGGMEMKRTPFGTNITLFVNKPGLVIGRHGVKIQEITENLEKKFKVESPQIEVKEITDPDMNPQVVSKKIALSLEKGWAYRKAGNTSLRRIMETDAKGVMIKIAGKISGERARSQKFSFGAIKYSGEPARKGMMEGFSIAKLKLGVIGITVRVLNPAYRLPDDISIPEKVSYTQEVASESEPLETEIKEEIKEEKEAEKVIEKEVKEDVKEEAKEEVKEEVKENGAESERDKGNE